MFFITKENDKFKKMGKNSEIKIFLFVNIFIIINIVYFLSSIYILISYLLYFENSLLLINNITKDI